MKVLLYYPLVTPTTYFPTWEPLQLIHLSRALRGSGIDVEILDGRLLTEEDRDERIKQRLTEDVLCFGITALTCFQLQDALRVAKYVKELNPKLLIVLGGWHATVFFEETIKEEAVDIVVRGQGEETFSELVGRLRTGDDLRGTKGISWKKDGIIMHEAQRALVPPDDFPPLMPSDFEKLDLQNYQLNNLFYYMSSVGCPYACRYCNVSSACSGRWIPLSSQRVIRELEALHERFHFREVVFWDNVFFTDKKRVVDICESLIVRGTPFLWSAHARINEVIRWDEQFLRTLKESGCKAVFIGAESGSQRILDMIDKKIKANDIIPSFRKLREHGIDIAVNWMVGFPGERYGDIKRTMACIREGLRLYDGDLARFRICLYRFVPFPHTPIFGDLRKEEFDTLPKSGREWANYIYLKVSDGMEPWREANTPSMFASTSFYLWKAYLQQEQPSTLQGKLLKMVSKVRVGTGFLRFPIEWQMWKRKHMQAIGKPMKSVISEKD